MKQTARHNAIMLRVARFLGSDGASVSPAANPRMLLLEAGERGAIAIPASAVELMVSNGLLERSGARLALTSVGKAFGERQRTVDVVPEGVGDLALIVVDSGSGPQHVMADLSESPLAQIARLRVRDGSRFLEVCEVNAGERLRIDYTRGQIMPRLGANWIASVASGRRHGAGGAAELTEAALSARTRVEKAIAAVGPELSGVLIDICCYLKGLERVEAERGWPARSAKIVLKSALGALNRHYDPQAVRRARPRVVHWGAEDFRPSING
jgi:hypothetical protein